MLVMKKNFYVVPYLFTYPDFYTQCTFVRSQNRKEHLFIWKMFVRHVMEQQSFMKMTKLGEIQCKIELFWKPPKKGATNNCVVF